MKYVGNIEPHYGLRKLSIGVASVLLGMTMYGIVGHADTGTPVSGRENVNVNKSVGDVSGGANDQAVLQGKQAGSDNLTSSQNVERRDTENQFQQSLQINENNSTANSQQLKINSNNTLQNIASYDDQKVEQQSVSDQAENVDLLGTGWESMGGIAQDDPSKINNGNPIYFGSTIYWRIIGSFDLTEQQLKSHDAIKVGTLSETQSPVSSYSLRADSLDGLSLKLNDGTVVGQLSYKNNMIYAVSNGQFHGSGTQHFNFTINHCETGYMPPLAPYRGVGAIQTTVTWQIGSHTYNAKIAAPARRPVVDLNTQLLSKVAQHSSAPGGDLIQSWSIANYLTDEQSKQWSQSHGQSVGNDAVNVNPGFETAFLLGGDDTITPTDFHIEKYGDIVDSDGNLRVDNGFVNSYGEDSYSCVNAGDGLTLDDLKRLSPNGSLGNRTYYSRQSDGSVLVYAKFSPSALKITDFDTLKHFANNSYTVNFDKDPDKALANTMNYYRNHNPLNGYPIHNSIVLFYDRADLSRNMQTKITYLDPASGKAIRTLTGFAASTVNLTVRGQSMVKLHVINSDNGAELQKVKSFTDWPNKGKHAELDLPNITGYQVVTNDLVSVLSRLHLTGTAITANTQADYPKENTIADYYIVMEPKTETATVNIVDDDENGKVLDFGQVSGKFNAGIVSDDVINAKLQKLLDSGLYTLESNDLEKGLTYKDESQTVTIKLKHKIDSVQRHYRAIEKLPDGSEKVILDYYATLYKDADAKYYNSDGAFLNGNPQNKVLVHNVYKIVVGHGNDIGADDDGFSEPLDYLPGYHLVFHGNSATNGGFYITLWDDQRCIHFDYFYDSSTALLNSHPELGGCTASPLPSQDFYVLYVKNQYPVTINYYDLSGKQISSSTTTHTYLDQVDASATAPKGYVLLSGQDSKLTVGWDHNELDLLVAPAITRTSQNKIVTRTINVENVRGQVIKTVVQTVNFIRNLLTDQVSHQATSTAWQAVGSNEFAAYTPSVIDGYTVDSIASQAVNGDDNNSVVVVRYHAVNTEKMPKYVDVNGIGYDKVLDGYEVVQGQDLNKNGILIIKKPTPVIANKIEYVTRTITVYMPNGRTRTIKQRARKGSKFLAVHLPKLRGYRVKITGNVDQAAADGNMTANVKFVKI